MGVVARLGGHLAELLQELGELLDGVRVRARARVRVRVRGRGWGRVRVRGRGRVGLG